MSETIDLAADAVERDFRVVIPAAVREMLIEPLLENQSFISAIETGDPQATAQLLDVARSIFEQGAAARRSRVFELPAGLQQQQQQQELEGQQIVVTAQDLLQFSWPWPIGPA